MNARSSDMQVGGPLAGVRVVEIDSISPLPFAGMMLADLGAEVLRIEAPRPRDLKALTEPDADPTRRGRWSLTADLRDPSDHDRILEIIKFADVLIEGLRPGNGLPSLKPRRRSKPILCIIRQICPIKNCPWSFGATGRVWTMD